MLGLFQVASTYKNIVIAKITDLFHLKSWFLEYVVIKEIIDPSISEDDKFLSDYLFIRSNYKQASINCNCC